LKNPLLALLLLLPPNEKLAYRAAQASGVLSEVTAHMKRAYKPSRSIVCAVFDKKLREKLDPAWAEDVKSAPSSEEVLKVFAQLSPMPFSKLGFSDRKLPRFMSELGKLWQPSVAPEVENLLGLSFDGLLVESNMKVGEWFALMDQSLRAGLAALDR